MQLSGHIILLTAVASNVCASLALKWASLLRKDGAPSLSILDVQPKELLVMVGALVFYTFAFAAYMFALRKVPVSIAYPVITGLTTMVLAVAAGPLFGESLSMKSIAGICLVLSGSFLLLKT
jgi:multidrug transporter EmrE-like cation transporter